MTINYREEQLVSVVMSVFNESIEELTESINSILSQTYSNIEFVIINDNPNNDIVNNFLLKYKEKDSRIVVITNEENLGLALSLNKGILSSSGDIIARMDADDISDKERIEKEVNLMNENGYDMVSSNCDNIDVDGVVVGRRNAMPTADNDIKKILPLANFICHPSVLIKRSVLECVGYYRYFKVSQDYDLWLRLLSTGHRIGITNEILLHYRTRDNSLSSNNIIRRIVYMNYQKKLYKERKKRGIDSYSIERVEELDEEILRYSNDKNVVRIVKGILEAVSNKRLFKFLKYYLLSIFCKERFINSWASDLIKYSLNKKTSC